MLRLLPLVLLLFVTPLFSAPRPRVSEDRDLTDLDVAGWDCLDRLQGTAKTPDGVERNREKNRSAIDLTGLRVEAMDTAAFLKHVAAFDAQTKGKHRTDLTPEQKQQLDSLEKQIVSLTGWLVLTYSGVPETTNCTSTDFHDWHLEIFEKSADHPPQIGDPTPIICEITPRTQRALYRDNIRLQALAGFFRRPDLTYELTGHPAQKIRLTGYLAWDDDHNGAADIGPTIQSVSANKYHHPWRSTPWEIHPVVKIEPLERAAPAPFHESSPPSASPIICQSPSASPIAASPSSNRPPSTPPAASEPLPPLVTLTQPLKIKIPYGETVLPRGMKLRAISRAGSTVVVDYIGGAQAIPVTSTDLR